MAYLWFLKASLAAKPFFLDEDRWCPAQLCDRALASIRSKCLSGIYRPLVNAVTVTQFSTSPPARSGWEAMNRMAANSRALRWERLVIGEIRWPPDPPPTQGLMLTVT